MTGRVVEVVTLELPRPISTNCLFANAGKRRVTSAKYADWQAEASLAIYEQRPGRIEGAYALTILVPAKWRGDLGNAEKAVSDLLQAHAIISNDKLAQKILLERREQNCVSVMVCSTAKGSGEE